MSQVKVPPDHTDYLMVSPFALLLHVRGVLRRSYKLHLLARY